MRVRSHTAHHGKTPVLDATEARQLLDKIGNHTFRATGITAYLQNGSTLENAAAMANHVSTRTTQLYGRRRDYASPKEVERIRL